MPNTRRLRDAARVALAGRGLWLVFLVDVVEIKQRDSPSAQALTDVCDPPLLGLFQVERSYQQVSCKGAKKVEVLTKLCILDICSSNGYCSF